MFLYVYVMGWIHRALWRVGIVTTGTAPSLYTAYHVYGIRPKPRDWVEFWYEVGWDCEMTGERIPFRSKIAHFLIDTRLFRTGV